ncbi:hypothetical protein EYZ11_007923 [Aspergillus tanneri]|uniref:Uncharacterized protein n=1 Tax=Aspergillus tanneri TaxID=1220188 RepID=A0A4S3JBR4_9EURO|nr:hypothetical protein EYZ11_007923 [Aspergillus tanneri]
MCERIRDVGYLDIEVSNRKKKETSKTV